MKIMYNTLIFYVQVPVAYISSLILTFLNILYVCFFIIFCFFKVNTRRILGKPKLFECINKAQPEPERSRSHVIKKHSSGAGAGAML